MPVTFGTRSFKVGRDIYAHPNSAVVAAAENPLNQRFSVVVVAGLSAESTLRTAPRAVRNGQRACEVLVLPNASWARSMVVPARELVHDFEAKK